MSRIVVIEKNKDGKIELTKEELQKMLDDAYTQGYTDGKGRYDTITYPSYPVYLSSTSGTVTNKDKVTLDGNYSVKASEYLSGISSTGTNTDKVTMDGNYSVKASE